MKAFDTTISRLACGALLALSLNATTQAAPLPKLHLVCSGVETVEIIYGTELDPPRKGDFRVEYNIDLDKKGIANASKKDTRSAKQGVISTYIHPGAQLGVMVEVVWD